MQHRQQQLPQAAAAAGKARTLSQFYPLMPACSVCTVQLHLHPVQPHHRLLVMGLIVMQVQYPM
jgi:hypothetical protein